MSSTNIAGPESESGGAGGAGDLFGPASSTTNALARFFDASGKIIKNSSVILTDTGAMSGLSSATIRAVADIAGTGTVSNVGVNVTGVGTLFLAELSTKKQITVNGITYLVTAVADNTHCTIHNSPGVAFAGAAFTISSPVLEIQNSAGTGTSFVFPNGDISVNTLITRDQPNLFNIGGGATPKLSIGFADSSIYHQLRAFGGANDNIGIDVLNPDTHYFAVNGQLHNSKGTQIGYAIGTTPATGGLNVAGYTKIGGALVAGTPTIQGDAINLEVGSANGNLGTTVALSNNSFSNPFTFFTAVVGIPARIYSLTIESSPTFGGESKKVFTSANANGIDYDVYIGSAAPSAAAYRFTATKSNGAGGNAAFAAGETVFTFNNRSDALLYLTGDGTGRFKAGINTGTMGTSAVPAFLMPSGDGIYSPAAGEIALSTGVTNFDSARFSYSGGTNSVWAFNTAFHLKDFSGNEFIRASGGASQALGFYGGAPVTQQAVGSTLVNNVTNGGVTGTVDNITAADIDATAAKLTDTRNAIYQLALKLRTFETAIKAISLIKT